MFKMSGDFDLFTLTSGVQIDFALRLFSHYWLISVDNSMLQFQFLLPCCLLKPLLSGAQA